MTIFSWIIVGLIVGALAKLVMPGRDPGGMIVTIILGIAGSLLGGGIGRAPGNGSRPAFPIADQVAQLNRQLFETTNAHTYATFFYAVYDDTDGRLTYTNAGHLPPLIVNAKGIRRLECGGTVIGIFPEAPYEQESVILQPGDLLVAYTDGISEPENPYGGEFGEARLIEVLQKVLNRPPKEVAQAILDAVLAWSDTPEAHDDMTLLVARRT